MSWQQHLAFLPGVLSGLGVRANYSYTTSTATVPGRADDPALLRQAPNNWNVDATYDRQALSARIGVTHNGANIFAYNFETGADGGITGPNGDQYLYPHTQVDAQASVAVSRQPAVRRLVPEPEQRSVRFLSRGPAAPGATRVLQPHAVVRRSTEPLGRRLTNPDRHETTKP